MLPGADRAPARRSESRALTEDDQTPQRRSREDPGGSCFGAGWPLGCRQVLSDCRETAPLACTTRNCQTCYPMNHEALRKMSYGLYVVSSADSRRRNGYVANTAFQVTAQPAQVAISCSKDNLTCELIRQSHAFSVSVLGQAARTEWISLFGYQTGRNANKYTTARHRTGETGVPILLEDSLAWVECRVVQTVDLGTHLLFVGEVVASEVLDDSQPPLTYAYYQEVRKGKSPKNAPTYVEPAGAEETSRTSAAANKYRCTVCGYIYDPAVGDPDGGIPPGTRFEDIPDDWVCPICGVTKEDFVEQPEYPPLDPESP